MAFNLGAALTSAGEIAPALTSAQEAERERKDTIARLGQESTAHDLANQQSRVNLDRSRAAWTPIRSYTRAGAQHTIYLTPTGYQDVADTQSPEEKFKDFQETAKKLGVTYSPEQQEEVFAKLSGAPLPSRISVDDRARQDYAIDPSRKPGETFEEWKARKAAEGRTAGSPIKQDAFHEFLSDPANYEKFLTLQAKVKSLYRANPKAGFGALFSARALLQQAYGENPALIPVAGELLSKVLEDSGVKLNDQERQALVTIPTGQPLSPSTGGPIGLKMPGAPTGATRSQAQVAQRVLGELPAIRTQVTSAADKLGPANGRLLIGFLLGTVGSTGDPAVDRQLAGLKTDLTFTGSAAAKFHINSVRQAELFENQIGAGKSSPEAIQGFIDSVEKWAKDTYIQELGFGEKDGQGGPGGQGTGSAVTPPPGARIRDYSQLGVK